MDRWHQGWPSEKFCPHCRNVMETTSDQDYCPFCNFHEFSNHPKSRVRSRRGEAVFRSRNSGRRPAGFAQTRERHLAGQAEEEDQFHHLRRNQQVGQGVRPTYAPQFQSMPYPDHVSNVQRQPDLHREQHPPVHSNFRYHEEEPNPQPDFFSGHQIFPERYHNTRSRPSRNRGGRRRQGFGDAWDDSEYTSQRLRSEAQEFPFPSMPVPEFFRSLNRHGSDPELLSTNPFPDFPQEGSLFGQFPEMPNFFPDFNQEFDPFVSFFPQRQASVLQFISNALGLFNAPGFDPRLLNEGSGPSFDDMFARMTALHPERVHPASQRAVQNIQTVSVSRAMETKGEVCTICQEQFKRSETANKLHCGHLFHQECVLPWLRTNNTCPVCRQSVD